MLDVSVSEFVIKRFGGVNACARRLNKTASTVQGWKESGTIHPRNWPDIERAAFDQGWLDLTARWLGEAHAIQVTREARIAAEARNAASVTTLPP